MVFGVCIRHLMLIIHLLIQDTQTELHQRHMKIISLLRPGKHTVRYQMQTKPLIFLVQSNLHFNPAEKQVRSFFTLLYYGETSYCIKYTETAYFANSVRPCISQSNFWMKKLNSGLIKLQRDLRTGPLVRCIGTIMVLLTIEF